MEYKYLYQRNNIRIIPTLAPKKEDSIDWKSINMIQINQIIIKPINDYAKNTNDKVLWTKWISKEEIKEQRKKGYCFRCGANNHKVRNCKFVPLVNPNEITKINTVIIIPMVEEVPDESSDDETKEAPKV